MSFTPMDDNESREGTIVSTEFFTQLSANLDYLLKSVPIGTVVPIMTGFLGVPSPDPNMWQLCDGSLITNPNSPIVNQNTPNLSSQKFLIKCGFGGAIGSTGGQTIVSDLGHNHTGFTEFSAQNPGQQYEEDGFAFNTRAHRHTIASDLTGSYDITPVNININHYIKIL